MTRASIAALVIVLAHAPLAGAQPARETRRQTAEEGEARRLFFVGAELFQEGDYEAALASWRSSYEARPAPVVKYNIALALRELFRYAEAVQHLREYLREADELGERRRADIVRAIEVLEARIAPIRLDVGPPGASIRIDGRDVGVAPLVAPLSLSAGRRRVEVEADGYVPVSDEISVTGQQARTIRIRLARRSEAGTIRVAAATPDVAELRIDGLEVGRAPLTRELPYGGHVIEARAPGFVPYRTSVELAIDQELDLRITLDPAREPSLLEQWWLWTAIGAVVAGGIIGIAIAAQPQEPAPIPGNSFGRVIEVLAER